MAVRAGVVAAVRAGVFAAVRAGVVAAEVVAVVGVVGVIGWRGVVGCCLTRTVGRGLAFLRSCSFINSCANHSSFSAFVWSASFFPRKSTDSIFLCDSISSASPTTFFMSLKLLLAIFDFAREGPDAY